MKYGIWFSDELGILDNNALLLTYQNFNTDGMVIERIGL
jgi:hypothetical protein